MIAKNFVIGGVDVFVLEGELWRFRLTGDDLTGEAGLRVLIGLDPLLGSLPAETIPVVSGVVAF